MTERDGGRIARSGGRPTRLSVSGNQVSREGALMSADTTRPLRYAPIDWRAVQWETVGLLVIDMQNDFAHPDGYFARQRAVMRDKIGCDPSRVAESVPRVKRLIEEFRAAGRFVAHTAMIRDVDAANDIHSIRRLPPLTYSVMGGPDAGTSPPLVPGSWGAALVDELAPVTGEHVILKRTQSAFYATDLELLLRRHGVRTLVLAGTLSHACLLHTAFDASARDMDVIIARQACATWAPDLEATVFDLLDLIVGRVADQGDLLAALEAGLEAGSS